MLKVITAVMCFGFSLAAVAAHAGVYQDALDAGIIESPVKFNFSQQQPLPLEAMDRHELSLSPKRISERLEYLKVLIREEKKMQKTIYVAGAGAATITVLTGGLALIPLGIVGGVPPGEPTLLGAKH